MSGFKKSEISSVEYRLFAIFSDRFSLKQHGPKMRDPFSECPDLVPAFVQVSLVSVAAPVNVCPSSVNDIPFTSSPTIRNAKIFTLIS